MRGLAPATLHGQREPEQPLPGQHAVELELERRCRARAADLAADHEVVDLDEPPAAEVDRGRDRRRLQERAVIERLEVPAAAEIGLDHAGRVGRLRPDALGKRHDRDRDRRADSLRDLDREIRPRRGREQAKQRRKHEERHPDGQQAVDQQGTGGVTHRGRIPG